MARFSGSLIKISVTPTINVREELKLTTPWTEIRGYVSVSEAVLLRNKSDDVNDWRLARLCRLSDDSETISTFVKTASDGTCSSIGIMSTRTIKLPGELTLVADSVGQEQSLPVSSQKCK